MKITPKEVNDLKQLIDDAGYETRDYSGRFMYGESCLAFETRDTANPFRAFADILGICDDETETEMVIKAMRDVRTDSLGRGTVIYFPSFEYSEDAEEEEETECRDCGAEFDAGIAAGVVCPKCRRGVVQTV